MRILFFLTIFILSLSNCSSSYQTKKIIENDLDTIVFDVVEKKLLIEDNFPSNIKILFENWFSSKVKINGFDGNLIFSLSNYVQSVSDIQDGKKVDMSLNFTAIITKKNLSKRKKITGTVSSYGMITGDFSLNDFDILIENTQKSLVRRLTTDLKSNT